MFFEAHMFMNVNVKKTDYKGISQMLATPGEGKRRDVRDGLSSFSLHSGILESWHPGVFYKRMYSCMTSTFLQR